uniref:L domain-like protein n=1 Tax=Grammatophora oceanica TaxID=210454 RepID=A0A7S1VI90_9STRA|mmetsp:Transcript_47266/g.70339  ORF Transcript_47266/g.70339 Transcript_47266/m.70339 type:complete len:883 (+) Transcript_47266:88-2736(+)|eukprot:CAMPEP_0194049756 /NCGR_PEP_ID=MMETSP0009_2-20130614/30876_1 /TAXON_ID=210454 /ORGANISM="Grammatophora oceanica, Strain CCMP 410" /LENGTH=882 /DNA_ID=CAMNT_0038695977 /DNA_START=88 /DNA_END=2736 /DNA_ORIENTATION=-
MPPESSKKTGKSRQNKPATVPGAVSVAADEDVGTAVSPAVVEPSGNAMVQSASKAQGQETAPNPNKAPRKSRTKKKRSKPATKPGAVSVRSDDESGDDIEDLEERGPPRTTTVVAAHGMSKPARLTTGVAVMPGAVSVQGDQNMATARTVNRYDSQNALQAAEEDYEAKARGRAARVTSGDAAAVRAAEEEASKNRARAPTAAATMPGVQSVTGDEAEAADAVLRRKDPRSRARNSRRNRREESAGAVPSANDESARDYRNRMEAKVQQMERELGHGNDDGKDGKSDELDKSTDDAKIVVPLGPSSKDEDPDKENRYDTEEPHFDNGETNALVADRGMAGAPGVEFGTTDGGFGGPGFGGIDDGALAVAVAIEEEETDVFLPAAVEYDPDAKPPLHKNRRFRLYTIAISLLLIVVIVGAIVGIVASKSGGPATYAPTGAPSAAPSTRADGEYSKQFVRAVGTDVEIPGTPAYKAAEWIMMTDPLKLPPDAPNLIQRFILANFYFTTSEANGSWRSCGQPAENESDDCIFQSIERLDNDTQVYDPKPGAVRWLSGLHECEWIGNQCDDLMETAAIEVWGQNLTGTIPSFLTELSLLQSISLSYNDFTGRIPSEFASMRHLINLELHGNELTGPIPEEYWGVESLQALNIGENKLTGTLSPDVGRLTDLKGLHIFENQFTGSFPVNVTTLQFLAFMRIDNNQFTGTFHTEFGKLTLLQELWYHKNKFDGTIPTEIGTMNAMTDLRIHDNELAGTIPEEIYSLPALFRLDVYDMSGIIGTISTAVGNLGKLEQLRLRENSMTGTVPTELGRCTSLRLAWLHLNELSGSMPESVCQLRGNVGSGRLEVLQTDCSGTPAPFQCDSDCCTSCCERDGSKICSPTGQAE